MDQIIDYLKQLELSDIEAKLYLTLLQSGPTSVRNLAESINVKRTTTYFYIDQLIEKGLIVKQVSNSKKIIAASPPNNLVHLVENKTAKAQLLQKDFPEILQSLNTALPQKAKDVEPEITYFKGMHNIKKIYEEALKTDAVRAYVKVESTDGLFENNLNLFDESFKRNPKLTVKEIIYDSPHATEDAKNILAQNDRYAYKLMPKELNLTTGDVLIYEGKVAILNYKGAASSIVLQSKDYYNNSKELFDFIWRMIP